jgi:hypothetical protein
MSWPGPFKRIRILDDFLVVFGGKPGYDTKIILKPLKEDYHYTMSMRHGSDWFSQPRIPIDFHKTYEGKEKEYESVGRGSVDLERLMNDLTRNAKVDLQVVDLRAPKWRNRRVLTFDERLLNLMNTKELNITADFAENFSPIPVSKLGESEFGLGIMTGRVVPGMLLKAADQAFSLGLPGFKGFEERLEEAMEFENLTDEEEDDDSDDIEDNGELDKDE